jgi:uncharacterized protein (TIGR03118 family)
MKKIINLTSLGIYLLSFVLLSTGCRKGHVPVPTATYNQVNLVANSAAYSPTRVDPTLLNAWGLVFSPGGTAWVNSMGGHVSEVYNKDGGLAIPAVSIPSPAGPTGGSPTGIVFNASTDFKLTNGNPARFIFVGVDGVLSGWNGGTSAQLIKNNVATSAYTGLALASKGGSNFLYAANFRAGRIDVWDNTFAPVIMRFKDEHIPSGYAPFNIQAVGSWLYVTYAKVGPDGQDQPGPGNGYVDVFNTDGSLAKRFAARGTLNAPWGIVKAASTFLGNIKDMDDDHDGKDNSGKGNSGKDDGLVDDSVLLVGNFGDGRINIFRENGDFLDQLKSNGWRVTIDGLWALSFPPATATTVDPNRLYFTAGPNDEKDGLFGYLIKK